MSEGFTTGQELMVTALINDMMDKHVENWPYPTRFKTALALIDKTLDVAIKALPAWRPIEEAPHACCVLAAYFMEDVGEWAYGVVTSPPRPPFTYWMPLPQDPEEPK